VGIFKTYGQTEAFRATSLRPEDYHSKPTSVGMPFTGVRVYVVNNGSRCAAGEIGEIVHTGLGTMLGYLGQQGCEHDSNRKLRENPFYGDDDPSPLAIFTGDLGYVDEEGYLYLAGRRDGMVKIMGNRVYPQEIMNEITNIPGVREVVVTSTPGKREAALVAFVTVSRVDLSATGIQRTLRTRLPAFMIPEEIVLVNHIPRTAHGKPDGQRLLQEHWCGHAALAPEGSSP
jgi:acyl-CoA synthetase (AMP-forming)/AMP-acid ligase II